MRLGKNLRFEKISGEPIIVGDTRLTPQSRVFSVRLPFGGFVWNHPASLVVERAGERKTMSVPDVTLMAQIALVVSLLALPLMLFAKWKGVKL